MTTANTGRTSRSPDEQGAAPPPGALRCSNAERERTSAALNAAAGDGRLSMDEVEERLAETYAARYRHELDAITADLPQAKATSGWPAIVTLVRQQLAADLAALTGRGGGTVSRRRKVVLALAALAVLLFALSTVFLVLHGFVGDGPEHLGRE